jgi:phosphate transport system protein
MDSHEQVRHFQEELERLKERILAMGGLAEDRVESAVEALVTAQPRRLEAIVKGDDPINQLHVEIDALAFRLLALYQPMASDLRVIVAAFKINADLERVGDMAVNIAEAALRYLEHPPVKPLLDIPRMADLAQAMLRDALDAFVRRDTALAQSVLDRDDTLDGLKTTINHDLLALMVHNPTAIEGAMELILISRHLERIGDHATNIAEDIIFVVSAKDVRHAAPPAS